MARSISNEFHKLPHLLIAINLNSTRELSEREEKTIKWMFIFEWATETKRYSINYYKIATITTERKEKRAKQKKRLCLHIIDVVRYYRSFDMCVSLFFFSQLSHRHFCLSVAIGSFALCFVNSRLTLNLLLFTICCFLVFYFSVCLSLAFLVSFFFYCVLCVKYVICSSESKIIRKK